MIPNVEVTTTELPTDPEFANQWDMGAPVPTESNGGAANVASIWSGATGAGAVVAVVDTGGTAHPDLVAAQPAGWGIDMVSDPWRGVDGDGRDTDPVDPGDDCGGGSTWHGTHVAGTIAAQHNEIGVAGIAPDAKIEHVRVLGRCGGSFEDVIDGIRWAAGLPTTYWGATWASQGLPSNEHPADVINLSLGTAVQQSWKDDPLCQAVERAWQANIVTVAAAGNLGKTAAGKEITGAVTAPGNCPYAITVGTLNTKGTAMGCSDWPSGMVTWATFAGSSLWCAGGGTKGRSNSGNILPIGVTPATGSLLN